MKLFGRKRAERINALEQEVHQEREMTDRKFEKFDRAANGLDQLVKQHLRLLHGESGETHT